MSRSLLAALAVAALAGGCGSLPGQPSTMREKSPDQVRDFKTLYANNCAGCHGRRGQGGAAIALDSTVYLSIADDGVLSRAISRGAQHTPMPAFARSAGGSLSDAQVSVLVGGIRKWEKPGSPPGAPPYAAHSTGDAQRGAEVFHTFCSSCHGPGGGGGKKAGSVIDSSYLALVSDQYLRTVVIAGRPKLGAPDWRGDVPGRPLTDQEVTDVVAWLASHRTRYPGQPYPNQSKGAQQ